MTDHALGTTAVRAPSRRRTAALLVRTSHPGPAVVVTAVMTAYGAASGLAPARLLLVAAAVLAGQLTLGWSNDLTDVARDKSVGRADKPLATGELSARPVRVVCAVVVGLTLVLSGTLGPAAGLLHLVCVAAGWAYNLGLKATVLSWLPYVVAFGGYPVVVALAGPDSAPPPWFVPAAGALLGVGAHLVNVLPDLADDAATGVRGLPHRLGPRGTSWAAAAVLTGATVLLAVAVAGAVPVALLVLLLAAVAVLVGLALTTRGRTPFRAALGVALVDVALLVLAA